MSKVELYNMVKLHHVSYTEYATNGTQYSERKVEYFLDKKSAKLRANQLSAHPNISLVIIDWNVVTKDSLQNYKIQDSKKKV